jgi:cysteine-rich repeat protein
MPCRRSLLGTLALFLLVAFARSADADPVKCQRTILKESLKFAQQEMKALGKCEDKVVAGALSQATVCATDPSTSDRIDKAESKLRAKIDKDCGGDDKSCGTGGDDDEPEDIDWPGTCPDFEELGCTNVVGDCDDVSECLFCVNDAAVTQAADLTFGDLVTSNPQTQGELNKCQRTLGKETVKFHKSVTKALGGCWDARHKGNHNSVCPVPGDGKTADKIAKAESKRVKKMCDACGGGDGSCGTGDDLSPTAIGFTNFCPNVASCGNPISTLQDVVTCLGCVTRFKADCESALAVPAFQTYPAACVTAPAMPVCGDGTAEVGEECDDGDTNSGDGCSSTCLLEDTSALCAGVPTSSGTDLDGVLVASGLDSPVHVTAPPLDPTRVFVVEQEGRIRVIKNGTLLVTPFLAIEEKTSCCGEQGLLSVAFHPDYETNGRFFVNYTDNSGDTVIARYQVTGNLDIADEDSEQILLTIDQPFANHNGGQSAFGPDGYLYVGMGDGGSGDDPLEAGQDDDTLLGKMLRIDVDVDDPPFYAAPLDNPGSPDPNDPNPLDLIWGKGLRNPWRFSFDRLTGEMYIGDVGQNQWEEIDIQPAGTGAENYGWDVFEGRVCYEPLPLCTDTCPSPVCPGSPTFNVPVLVYSHGVGCSVTGGFAYRGCALPDLHGRYFYSDYCSAFIRSFLGVSGGDAQNEVDYTSDVDPPGGLSISNVTSFGEDARGELYVTDHNGEVFKLVPEN